MAEANGVVEKASEDVKEANGVEEMASEDVKVETADEKAATVDVEAADMEAEPAHTKEETADVREERANGDITTLDKQIIRQIEYYFGDINLPRDKFLQEQIKVDSGWIPLDVMLKFNRLASISKDVNVILAALEKATSGLMEISEDKKKIRRSPNKPLPQQNEERRKELQGRTVYVKGFPMDITLDTLLEFFQPYGPIDSVQMRSWLDKTKNESHFKGSTFTVFSSKDKADEFLKLEEVKYADTVLIKMWQLEYLTKKREEREEKVRLKKSLQKMGGEAIEEEEKQQKNTKSFPKGTVMHLKGDFNNMEREKIKARFEELGASVGYVGYMKGDEECWVRFMEEGAATTLAEGLEDDKIEIEGQKLEARVLEGDEETEYLEKAMNDKLKRLQNQKSNQRGKRGGRQGGRGRGGYQNRKRKADDARGEATPAKVAAIATE